MTPISGPPNIGYADWQRIVNWDEGPVSSLITGGLAAPFNTGVMNISRYESLAGLIEVAGADVSAFLTWYVDQAGATPLRSQFWYVSQLIGEAFAFTLPALSSWASILLTPHGAANPSVTFYAIPTNRRTPLVNVPFNPRLLAQTLTAIGGGATVDVYPDTYYTGPMRVWITASNANMQYQLWSAGLTGGGTMLEQAQIGMTGNPTIITPNAPLGLWWIAIVNNGAAGTFNIAATPTLTGSS